jgi:chromatin remodeling complex protein RSC6
MSTTNAHFQKQVHLSDKLVAFMGLSAGSSLARAEITRSIVAYCKARGLLEEDRINTDAALRELLGMLPGDSLR